MSKQYFGFAVLAAMAVAFVVNGEEAKPAAEVDGAFRYDKVWDQLLGAAKDGKLTKEPFGLGKIPESGWYMIRLAIWNILNFIIETVKKRKIQTRNRDPQ